MPGLDKKSIESDSSLNTSKVCIGKEPIDCIKLYVDDVISKKNLRELWDDTYVRNGIENSRSYYPYLDVGKGSRLWIQDILWDKQEIYVAHHEDRLLTIFLANEKIPLDVLQNKFGKFIPDKAYEGTADGARYTVYKDNIHRNICAYIRVFVKNDTVSAFDLYRFRGKDCHEIKNGM